MMGIIFFLAFGLLVGLVARFLIPGRQPLSLLVTMLLGVGGSLLGGFVANLIYGGRLFELNTVGFIGAGPPQADDAPSGGWRAAPWGPVISPVQRLKVASGVGRSAISKTVAPTDSGKVSALPRP